MNIDDYISGNLKEGYKYEYFLPEPINHNFSWDDKAINELLEKASLKLGELNSFSRFIPNTDMFILMHIFKEAVISSRIEGTQTNMKEALIDQKDLSPEKRDDQKEVLNYVEAMNFAINYLSKLPLSNRLFKETHKKLLEGVRGANKMPGEFRTSQNWIGGASLNDAVFIPPNHKEAEMLMNDLELFLNNDKLIIPHLIRIAIAHYQFETIHPFLDGNGRMGRLLITLYLVSNNVLNEPLLYLSEYFERNKTLYFDNLTFVRTKNDMKQWLKFFLNGVIETADKSISTLEEIRKLKEKIENDFIIPIGRSAESALKLINGLYKLPIVKIKDVENITGLSNKASTNLVKKFIDAKILVEQTGNKRNRNFAFQEYIELFTT